MRFLIFLAVVIGLMLLVVYSIIGMKAIARRRSSAGLGAGIDIAFSVFDPARARAIVQIELRKEIGDSDQSDAGEKHDPSRSGED